MLRSYAERNGAPWISWLNLAGFLLGMAIMYYAAFLVKFLQRQGPKHMPGLLILMNH